MSSLPDPDSAQTSSRVRHHWLKVEGIDVFYREAGDPLSPTIVLLHGFPSSSHMFRDLIPELAAHYHLVAPDLPGFGFTLVPDALEYRYTFEQLAETTGAFLDALGLTRYGLYVFDYGAPVGFRHAVEYPERISALISQNGNAYLDGLGDAWDPIRAYWSDPAQQNRDALRGILTLETTRWQYETGVANPEQLAPEAYYLDTLLMGRPGNKEIQLDLFLDYASNLERYPDFQAYFRDSQIPTLVIWGKHDPFFIPPGAHAFRRDNENAVVELLDTGHFALETHSRYIASRIHAELHAALAG